ncbi:hypothetical protein HDU67_003758 [Dinochytrium kinnereticum]|nr:hypothetical protein HDU67_003758 [Dinochytrium kinnereticum]
MEIIATPRTEAAASSVLTMHDTASSQPPSKNSSSPILPSTTSSSPSTPVDSLSPRTQAAVGALVCAHYKASPCSHSTETLVASALMVSSYTPASPSTANVDCMIIDNHSTPSTHSSSDDDESNCMEVDNEQTTVRQSLPKTVVQPAISAPGPYEPVKRSSERLRPSAAPAAEHPPTTSKTPTAANALKPTQRVIAKPTTAKKSKSKAARKAPPPPPPGTTYDMFGCMVMPADYVFDRPANKYRKINLADKSGHSTPPPTLRNFAGARRPTLAGPYLKACPRARRHLRVS